MQITIDGLQKTLDATRYTMKPYNETDTWLADGHEMCHFCGTTHDIAEPGESIGWMALIPVDKPTTKVQWSNSEWTEETNVEYIACCECAVQIGTAEASLRQDIYA